MNVININSLREVYFYSEKLSNLMPAHVVVLLDKDDKVLSVSLSFLFNRYELSDELIQAVHNEFVSYGRDDRDLFESNPLLNDVFAACRCKVLGYAYSKHALMLAYDNPHVFKSNTICPVEY